VRVNVQLINAQTDFHLWAHTYNRKLIDIFGVESEIAKRIAESLQAKLSGREEQALAAKPTNNTEAYDAYLRGLTSEERWNISDSAPNAAGFYERAVQLDPNFAIAWARLSRAHSIIYPMLNDTTGIAHAARGDAARRALEQAQKLEPNSPETLLALGYYQYRVLRDYGPAKTTFERVSEMLPGSSEVPYALGQVAGWDGHWDESISYFEQALSLDPRNVKLLLYAAWRYTTLRQFPAALKLYDRALDIMPNDPEVMANKASIYQAQGNLQEGARLLLRINEQTPHESAFLIQITRLRLERNYGEAIRLLQARLAQFQYDTQDDKGWDQATLAILQRLAGDTRGTKVTAEQARNTLEPLYREGGHDIWVADVSAMLSQIYAAIGEKDLAVKAAERAVMAYPRAIDPSVGSEENLALIWTIFGENGRAIRTLRQMLQTPHNGWLYNPTPITPALLRLDPIWDSLRSDPAFQKLCQEEQN
jgi:tetratricopeptide (TPR) repeat protein